MAILLWGFEKGNGSGGACQEPAFGRFLRRSEGWPDDAQRLWFVVGKR
jgi:hypothetical protein